MRILHTVEFYYPSVGGAQEVVKQISEGLVRRGHDVTVATARLPNRSAATINGVHIEEFSISGNAVRGFRGEVDRYQEFLRGGSFDIMMNYAAQQWATDLVFPILAELPYRKVLAPCGFSALHIPEYASYFSKMPAVMRQYDHLVFHSYSYRDIEFARNHGLLHCTIIPNGASQEEFSSTSTTFRKRYDIPEDVPMLLTIGDHTGLKGHALVIEAFRRARIRRAALVIIGKTSDRGCLVDCKYRAAKTRVASLGRKRVLLLKPPRREVVEAYHAADLFVFGSAVECSPIVLFEATASKVPFITTACGNAEEIVNWTNGGIVIPTVRRSDGYVEASSRSMAYAIEYLLNDPQERARLGEAGYRSWFQRFTWEKIVVQYEQLYQMLKDQ
mgnify:CR=1 FL=1